MDTYREAAQIRAGGSAGNKAGGRQRQAFEPTPGRTNAEKLQAINEFEDIRFRIMRLEDHAEQAASAGKIALP